MHILKEASCALANVNSVSTKHVAKKTCARTHQSYSIFTSSHTFLRSSVNASATSGHQWLSTANYETENQPAITAL